MKRKIFTYEQLKRIGGKYYNDDSFCGVVCIAVAAQVSFGRALAATERLGRQRRKGTNMRFIIAAAAEMGAAFERTPHELGARGRNFSTVYRSLPKQGVFVVLTTHHITCIVDGEIKDWIDPTRRHKVCGVWEVKRNFDEVQAA